MKAVLEFLILMTAFLIRINYYTKIANNDKIKRIIFLKEGK